MFVSHSSEFRTSERNLSHRFTAFRLIGCLALAVIFGLTQFDVAKLFSQEATRSGPTTEDVDSPELLFFYDETTQIDPTSAAAIKTAVESGFRIREIAARRFPRLAERFKVRSFPSLIMLRRDRTHARHDGRFTFGRIREMFARARERRLERREDFREDFREMLAGSFRRPSRSDAPPTAPGNNPAYVQTSTNSATANPTSLASSSSPIPKPLDRNGRFPVAHAPTLAEQIAFNATVRLRVVDPGGTSHGTGTIIHSNGNDALILTCGHIFRESKGRGKIEGDVNFASGMQRISGQLISFDAKAHDVALIAIRTSQPIQAAPLAPPTRRLQLNQPVFTVGCDKANAPTIRRSHYKRVAIYDSVEKYDVYGRPIDGRSGGGLFDEQGRLIGVCNAAAVHVDEGIYSGLRTIYGQLASSHLVQLFSPSAGQPNQTVAAPRNQMASDGFALSNRNDADRDEFTKANSSAGLNQAEVRIPPSNMVMTTGWTSAGRSLSPTARLRDLPNSQNEFANDVTRPLPVNDTASSLHASNSQAMVPVLRVPVRDPQSGIQSNVVISLNDLPADLAAKVKAVAATKLANEASRIRALSPELKR